MELILSKQCESLTGSLRKGFGYHIQRRKNGFFTKRNSSGDIPKDGHLRFIFACADLARMRLHITDIRVPREEMEQALREAGCTTPHYALVKYPDDFPETFSANDVLSFKNSYNL